MPGGHFSDMEVVFHDWMPDVSIAAKTDNKQNHTPKSPSHTHNKNSTKTLPPDTSEWISN